MKRYGLATLTGCVLVSIVALSICSGQQKGATDESRHQFLKAFQRIPMNTPPEDALFLRILVECRKAQRGIEVGSANGYGAIHMGIGFERTGGHLYTIDINPKMVKECRENVRKAGLAKTITCIEGDALKVLPDLKGEFDFLFLDAVKRDTFKYFKAVSGRLKVGAVVVAHNAVRSAGAMKDFLDFMKKSPDWEMVIIRTGRNRDGMAVCYKHK